jgi:hypothetical protein
MQHKTIPNTSLDYFHQQVEKRPPETEFEEMVFDLWVQTYGQVKAKIDNFAKNPSTKVSDLRAYSASIAGATIAAVTDWFTDAVEAAHVTLGVNGAMDDARRVQMARGLRLKFPDQAEKWLEELFGPDATTDTHAKASAEIQRAMLQRVMENLTGDPLNGNGPLGGVA